MAHHSFEGDLGISNTIFHPTALYCPRGAAVNGVTIHASSAVFPNVARVRGGTGEPDLMLLHAVRMANAASTAVIASSTIAESASDQWTPIRLPKSPMVTPEKARKPRFDMP